MSKLALNSKNQSLTAVEKNIVDRTLDGTFDRFYDASISNTVVISGSRTNRWADRGLSKQTATQDLPSRYPVYRKTNKTGVLDFLRQDKALNFSFPNGFNGRLFISSLDGLLNLPITIPVDTTIRCSGTSRFIRFNWSDNWQSPIIGMFFITNQKWDSLSANEKTQLEELIRDWHESKGGADDNFASLTTLSRRFLGGNSFYNQTIEFPVIDTRNVRDMTLAFMGCHRIKSLPWMNTSRVTTFSSSFNDVRDLEAIPLLDTSSAFSFSAFIRSNKLRAIPPFNTPRVTFFGYAFEETNTLTSFPLINTTVGNAFIRGWRNCSLTQQSVDNILISIAAGFAANPSKQFDATTVGSRTLTGANNAVPGNVGRSWTSLSNQTETLTNDVSWSSISNNELVFTTSHKLAMGREVKITEFPENSSIVGQKLFVIWVSLTRIKLATTLENALAGISIPLSGTTGKLYEVYEFNLNVAPWTALQAINGSFTKADGTQVSYDFTQEITGQQAKSYLLDVHRVDIETR